MALCKAAELELTLSDFPILKDFFVIADGEATGDWLGPDVAPSDEDKLFMLLDCNAEVTRLDVALPDSAGAPVVGGTVHFASVLGTPVSG